MKLSVIDPQNDPLLVDYIVTRSIATTSLPYNFYSILQYGIMVPNLFPLKDTLSLLKQSEYGDGEVLLFDQAYAHQLLAHEPSFLDLMRVLCNIEYYEEIMLISNYTNDFMMPIIDSLLKFIYERYGLDAFIINTIDDIDNLSSSQFFSQLQYMNLSNDIQRYYQLMKIPIPVASEEEIEEDFQSLKDSYYGNL